MSGVRRQVSGVRKDRETYEPDDSLQDSCVADVLDVKGETYVSGKLKLEFPCLSCHLTPES
jgi:hypothetical protein